MGQSVNLKDLGVFSQLQTSLGRFAGVVHIQFIAAEKEIIRTQEWLFERKAFWQKQVQVAQNQVQQAEMALRRCQSRTERDNDGHYKEPDCSGEIQALVRAKQNLQTAIRNLEIVKKWQIRFEQNAADFRKQSNYFQNLTGKHTTDSCTRLGQLSKKYLAVQRSENQFGMSEGEDTGIIRASSFSSEIKEALEKLGLNDVSDALKDNTGKTAEDITRAVLSEKGLPQGDGNYIRLKTIIPGQYNPSNNGIDLIGVTENGEPVLIEVKKRANSNNDDLGIGNVQPENFEPETITLRNDILRERSVNPVLRDQERIRTLQGEPDSELSLEQMSGLWSRDRWIKAIKDEGIINSLKTAGISENYLDISKLSHTAYTPEWEKILNSRTAVIVSSNKSDVSSKVYRQALFRKGLNITIIDLDS